MTDKRGDQQTADSCESVDCAVLLQQELTVEIKRLNRLSTRGIQAVALFIAASVLAWWGFLFLPAPDVATALLGRAPSANIISIVLVFYTFSAIILSLSRMTAGIEHRSSFCHVGYLALFFLFYYFAKSLEENFWAVFGSGITILGVESYRIWSFCSEAIAIKRSAIEYVSRTGRPPPQE